MEGLKALSEAQRHEAPRGRVCSPQYGLVAMLPENFWNFTCKSVHCGAFWHCFRSKQILLLSIFYWACPDPLLQDRRLWQTATVMWLHNCSALRHILITKFFDAAHKWMWTVDLLSATCDHYATSMHYTSLCTTNLCANDIFFPQEECWYLGSDHVCFIINLHHMKAVLWSQLHAAASRINKCTNNLLNITQLYAEYIANNSGKFQMVGILLYRRSLSLFITLH